MTDQEFAKFIEELFLTYPGLSEWLAKNSPDPKRTQAIWRGQLRNYELSECVLVLDKWKASSNPPFAAYERDQIMNLIRASINSERDKKNKREFTEQSAKRREDYRPLADDVPGLGDILRKGILVANRWKAGEIAIEERDRLQRKIIDESFK